MLLSERFVARPRLALLARAHRRVQCSSVPPEPAAGEPAAGEEPSTEEPERRRRRRQADSSDPIASFLSRRFGLAGGLAWLGILTFGVVSEQLKTRGEAGREREGTRDVAVADQVERTAPSGLGVTELRLGGGESTPRAGDLLALSLRVEDASTGATLLERRTAQRLTPALSSRRAAIRQRCGRANAGYPLRHPAYRRAVSGRGGGAVWYAGRRRATPARAARPWLSGRQALSAGGGGAWRHAALHRVAGTRLAAAELMLNCLLQSAFFLDAHLCYAPINSP